MALKIERHIQGESDLPSGLAKPAQRALANAGCRKLKDLTKVSEDEVKQVHGMGPKAVNQLGQALRAHGLAFAQPNSRKKIRSLARQHPRTRQGLACWDGFE